jgi:hypothetical protein
MADERFSANYYDDPPIYTFGTFQPVRLPARLNTIYDVQQEFQRLSNLKNAYETQGGANQVPEPDFDTHLDRLSGLEDSMKISTFDEMITKALRRNGISFTEDLDEVSQKDALEETRNYFEDAILRQRPLSEIQKWFNKYFRDIPQESGSEEETTPKGAKSGSGLFKSKGSWISHVKSYAKKHRITYKEALSKAKSTYKKSVVST